MNSNHAPPALSAAHVAASDWIEQHLDELGQRYPNQWVAVHDGRVVGAGDTLREATEAAERVAPPEDVAYHFVDDGTLIFRC